MTKSWSRPCRSTSSRPEIVTKRSAEIGLMRNGNKLVESRNVLKATKPLG